MERQARLWLKKTHGCFLVRCSFKACYLITCSTPGISHNCLFSFLLPGPEVERVKRAFSALLAVHVRNLRLMKHAEGHFCICHEWSIKIEESTVAKLIELGMFEFEGVCLSYSLMRKSIITRVDTGPWEFQCNKLGTYS